MNAGRRPFAASASLRPRMQETTRERTMECGGGRYVGASSSRRRRPGTHPDLPSELASVYVQIYQAALPKLGTRHNDLHARVSCQYALEILTYEGGDPRVTVPAVLLHDLGWNAIPEDLQRTAYGPGSNDVQLNRRHEVEGARTARELLHSLCYPAELLAEIARIIEGHDSVLGFDTIEEAIVKDSDKLWRMSGVGFPVLLELFRPLSPQGCHDWLAAHVDGWMLTATGLRLAKGEIASRREEFRLDLRG
jgi:hypothetical protein